MQEYFENTTRLTEEGYRTVLRMKRQKQSLVCRAISIVMMVPFLERFVYFILTRMLAGQHPSFSLLDVLFFLLLLTALFLWNLPNRQITAYVSRTRNHVDLQAVNQYTFLPEEVRMMTTSSLEKFRLSYEDLTWVRSNSRWIVLCFEKQNFTMLVDRQGFTRGTAAECLVFLRRKETEFHQS